MSRCPSGVAVIDTASNNRVVDLNTTTTTVDVIKVGSGSVGAGHQSHRDAAVRQQWK